MPQLLTRNAKMRKSGKDRGVRVVNFGIPAGFSRAGLKVCPNMALCARGCYAKQGTYVWTPVRAAYEWRLAQTLESGFVGAMGSALQVARPKNGDGLVVRIHDSGDFYSEEYYKKWERIAQANPRVLFYAYTKMVSMTNNWRSYRRIHAPNFRIIHSYGGTEDTAIDRRRSHSRVFDSYSELEAAGYTSAMDDDIIATESIKIGLVYHGANGKRWSK